MTVYPHENKNLNDLPLSFPSLFSQGYTPAGIHDDFIYDFHGKIIAHFQNTIAQIPSHGCAVIQE